MYQSLRKHDAGELLVDGELVGYELRSEKLYELKRSKDLSRTLPDRNGVPAIQSLPEPERPREHHGRADQSKDVKEEQAKKFARELLERVGLEGKERTIPRNSPGAAATRRDRTGPRDGAEIDVVRRADGRRSTRNWWVRFSTS